MVARQRDKDNALPFLPFYDVLCPLVPENEKVRKGTRDSETASQREERQLDRDNALPFMPFYDVLCPLVPKNEKVRKGTRDSETARHSEVGYHKLKSCPPGRYVSFYLAYKQLGLPTRGSPIVIGVERCYQMITRSSTGRYIASSSVTPKASYHDCMLRSVAFTRLRPRECTSTFVRRSFS